MRLVRDDPDHPDPGFADLYAGLPYETELEPWLGLARAAAPPVLYLGIGTGRLAVPLAHTGVVLVGVDSHPGMLEVLRRRLPAIRAVQARIEDLDLPDRFELVMAPSHVVSTPGRLLRAARHLAPGGRLALELMNPHWLTGGEDPNVRVMAFTRERARVEVDYPTGHTHADQVNLVWPEDVETFLSGARLRLVRLEGGGSLAEAATYFVVAERIRAGRPRSGS